MNSFVITGSGLLLTIIVSSITFALPIDKETLKEAAKNVLKSCKISVGASDADLQDLTQHKIPQTHEGLCMLECVFESSNVMQRGKYNKYGFIDGFKPFIGDDSAKLKSVEQLASTCEKEIGQGSKDKCETAKLLVECIMKNGKSHGLDIPTSS